MQFIQSFFTAVITIFLTLYFLENTVYLIKKEVLLKNNSKYIKEMIVNIKLIIQSKILHIFSFCGNNFSKAPTNNIRNMTTSNNVSDIYYTSETTFSSSDLNLYCCIFSPFS